METGSLLWKLNKTVFVNKKAWIDVAANYDHSRVKWKRFDEIHFILLNQKSISASE